MFECGICTRKFTRKGNVLRHMNSVHREKKFQCNSCNKTFSRKDDMTRHVNTLHPKDDFECNLCNIKFQDKQAVQSHKKLEHSLKCSKCQNTYSTQSNFNSHKVQCCSYFRDTPAKIGMFDVCRQFFCYPCWLKVGKLYINVKGISSAYYQEYIFEKKS